jgi:hypothetical protein
MKQQKKYKTIAAFLLTVFSLNTVVGFACSVGLDMGYNSKHHHEDEATEAVVHIHKDGKKHVHYEKKDSHSSSKSHKQDQAKNHHSDQKKDDCCGDEVTRFSQLDKTVPASLDIIHPIFLTSFFDIFSSVVLPSSDIIKDIKQFVRSYHPPIPDIRIAIQSFQI